jgi:thiamine pyrophosphokinase
MKKSCIIAGGVCDGTLILKDPTAYYIAADSGLNTMTAQGITPDLIIGDFDSFKGVLPGNIETITLPRQKDETDTISAVLEGFKRGYTDFSLYGVIGGRFDHTFASIQTLLFIQSRGGHGRIFTQGGCIFTLDKGDYTVKKTRGYISLFSLTDTAVISTEGLKYNLQEYPLNKNYPQGVSNEFLSDEAKIHIKSGILLVIFSTE